MNQFISASLLTLTALLATPAIELHAQTGLRELFDADTVGFVRVDLEELDMNETADMVVEMLGEGTSMASQLRMFAPMAAGLVTSLKNAGATDLHVIQGLGDVPLHGPYFFVSCPDEAAGQSVVAVIEPLVPEGWESKVIELGVLVARPAVLERLADNPLQLRSDNQIDALMLSAGTAPIALVIEPSAEHRRAIAEVLPQPSAPFENISPAMLAHGASGISLQIRPDLRELTLKVSGVDESANRALASELADVFGRFGRNEASISALQNMSLGTDVGMTISDLQLDKVFAETNIEPRDGWFQISFNKADGSFDRLCTALSATARATESASIQQERSNNIRQLVLACHNYHDWKKSLPPTAIVDEEGRPLLSWRVAVLPFLEQGKLYEQFRLDEPWDSEHNRELISRMPRFLITHDNLAAEGKTTLVMPTGESAIGRLDPLRFRDIIDGTSNTILILDAAPESAVIWTKPDDWEFDPANPLRGLFADGQQQIRTGFADGSVHVLPKDEADIRARLTVAGEEE
ncbi:MAG: DUF1559 domain-containing protein [Pirellulaceae bacterium]